LNQRRIELKANKQTIKQTKDKTVKDDLYKKRDLINEKYEKILSGEQQEIKQNTPINVLTGTVNTKKYKFVAVCGQGLGSSMIVELNVKKTLNFLNINADVTHTNLNSFDPNDNSVDAIIVGKDLATSINFKNKIVLDNLLNQKEISEKITEFLKNKQ
jgi:PTS system ascorbate-specific IIC component